MNWALAEVERTLEESNNMTDLAGYNDNCIAIAKLVGVPFIELKTLLVLLCTQMHHASRPLQKQCQLIAILPIHVCLPDEANSVCWACQLAGIAQPS